MPVAEIEVPFVDRNRLAAMNRRRNPNKLSESISGAYYHDMDGWVKYAEGPETTQGQRLMTVKGWQLIEKTPRPSVNAEHDNRYHALLRVPQGPSQFSPAQIVSNNWHKKPPVVFTCRQPLDDIEHPEHTQDCFAQVHFPQLRGVDIFEASCGMCRKYFATTESQAFADSCIKAHMEVAHKDHLVNKELTTGLTAALAPLVGGSNAGGFTAEQLSQIAQVAATAAIVAIEQRMTVSPNPEGNAPDEKPAPRGRSRGTPERPATPVDADAPVQPANPDPEGAEDEDNEEDNGPTAGT